MHYPGGVAVDASDNVYIADSYNHRILKMAPDGAVTVILGTGKSGFAANQLNFPRTLAVDRAGNVFVADSYNHRVQKLTPEGEVTTIAGRGGQGNELTQLSYPRGVAVDDTGNVFVSDNYNHRVLKITSEGIITLAAGGRGQGNAPDQLNFPFGIAIDRQGALYIGDAYNHRVQKVAADGTVTTAAGVPGGGNGYNQLVNPVGVDVDGAGNLYISDTNNNRIQKYTPDGQILTVAGGNGDGADEKQLSSPFDTAVDSTGALYIADTFNHRIERVIFPANSGAPQLRNAATNRPGPAAPNLLVRLSPPLSCPEPLSIVVGGFDAISATANNETTFIIPESVDPAVPTDVYTLCQSRSLLPVLKLPMTTLQPRLFTSWSNQPLAENAADFRLIDAANPSRAMDLISLYGTGFGALEAPDDTGRRRVKANVTATIGDVPAEVLYAGTASGQTIGLQQINLRIPADAKPGMQPVLIFADRVPTQGGVVIAVR